MQYCFLILAVISGCTSKGHLQGQLKGERVPCGADLTDVAVCRSALEAFFKFSPEVRVAGIDAIYGSSLELVVWTTESSAWPRANELTVNEVPCVRSVEGPDCLSPIDSLWIGRDRDHHAFLVPLFSESDHRLGSWSFLDVQTEERTSPHPEHVVEVPCRLEDGQVWYDDAAGKGVMAAKELRTMHTTDTAPERCQPALTLFLRTNPDLHIRGIVPEDGKGGTRSLLVLTGSPDDRSPRARDLSIGGLGCPGGDCPSVYISLRNAPSLSRSLFSFPIGTQMETSPLVADLVVVSLVK
jgi:hypothetical protein